MKPSLVDLALGILLSWFAIWVFFHVEDINSWLERIITQ